MRNAEDALSAAVLARGTSSVSCRQLISALPSLSGDLCLYIPLETMV